ncbi:tRNA(His) guanylyltransferase Thg1 family protein [Nocardia sp. NPDC051030]|uniref:tRNA(His) guanylyltransferase Thg1 family protein n=1 Tax=Nocardia sp. NPDC051030 TaxID=3155162 RepID=UPI00341F6C0B
MRFGELDAVQRRRERYHGLTVLAGDWIVVRVDGRAFTTLTNAHFTKPFDDRFGAVMEQTAAILIEEFEGLYSYVQSDEISVLLPRTTTLFDRGVEKIVSVAAATAAAAFTESAARRAVFDGRLWIGDTRDDVVDYFAWRQADAERNALNTCAYWTLRQQGLSGRQAQHRMSGITNADKRDIIAAHGTPFDELPLWQRRGVGIWYESFEKTGYDPKSQRQVTAIRRRLRHESALSSGADYRDLITARTADR